MRITPNRDFDLKTKKIKKNLKKKDIHKLLHDDNAKWYFYLDVLTELFSFVNKFEKYNIFEIGARQDLFEIKTNIQPMYPSISHFLTLNNFKNFFAYDSNYSDFDLDFAIAFANQAKMNNHTNLTGINKYLNIDLNELGTKLKKISITNYKSLKNKVNQDYQKGIMPIIFSKDVLNCPDLNYKNKFWNLNGRHIHFSYIDEICSLQKTGTKKHIINQKINSKIEYIKTLQKEINNNPKKHLDALRNMLKFEKDIKYRFLGNHIVYKW